MISGVHDALRRAVSELCVSHAVLIILLAVLTLISVTINHKMKEFPCSSEVECVYIKKKDLYIDL